MDDSEIVALYLKRDEKAIAHTTEKYGGKLLNIINRILNDRSYAEECLNDTYLEIWNRIPPSTPDSYFFAFAASIARHMAIDRLRKEKSLKRTAVFIELTAEMEECISSGNNTENVLEAKELTHIINTFLSDCPEWKRNVFVRRYWFFDAVNDIADKYGISESKVKTTLFRMRKDLKKYLEKEGFTV